MFADSARVVTVCLKFATPQLFLHLGQRFKTSRVVRLFIIVTIFVTLYAGIDCIKKWTWSWSVPISKNFTWYRFSISRQTSFKTLSTCSSKTTLLYLAGNTKWYLSTVTLWLLWIDSLIPPFYAASGGEYNPKGLNGFWLWLSSGNVFLLNLKGVVSKIYWLIRRLTLAPLRKKNSQPLVAASVEYLWKHIRKQLRRLSVKLAPSYPNRFMPLQHEVLSQMLFSIIAFAFTVYKPQLGLQ